MKNLLIVRGVEIDNWNTTLREALAFLLDNPNDDEAREVAERAPETEIGSE